MFVVFKLYTRKKKNKVREVQELIVVVSSAKNFNSICIMYRQDVSYRHTVLYFLNILCTYQ